MSVLLKTGSATLVCDGIDKGQVEYSVAIPVDGLDLCRRGKLWGNKAAIADAMMAAEISLRTPEAESYPIEIREPDRNGAALFTVSVPAK